MKKTFTLILATGTLFIAGCCTTHYAKAWDYKVLTGDFKNPLEPQIQKAAAEGWVVVSSGGGDQVTFVVLRKPK
jgi:hypothetical protein